uniref:Uncharacterized protein n=1 Tax=Angiostrongylus cantonensis TaxID=6313 RepID=A0A0K0DBQ0_ANGCA
MLQLLSLFGLFTSTHAFFFGNSGCGCAPPPVCPPPPMCALPAPPPCPPPAQGCGGGSAAYQQAPRIPPPAFSVGAPSYSQTVFPHHPPYQLPQTQHFPSLPNGSHGALPTGPVGQLPVQNYEQIPPEPPHPPVQEVKPAHQNLQPEAASAAGQKIEEVIEEEEGALEKAVNESTEASSNTTTTEALQSTVMHIANLKLTDDSLCNSEELRKIMLDIQWTLQNVVQKQKLKGVRTFIPPLTSLG